MNDGLTRTIDLYCYLILRGKPCACIAVQSRYTVKISKRIEDLYHLKFYLEDLDIDWVTVWIYKEDYMKEIIELLPEQPKTIFEHWILGKAFGYSEEAIKDFLNIKS